MLFLVAVNCLSAATTGNWSFPLPPNFLSFLHGRLRDPLWLEINIGVSKTFSQWPRTVVASGSRVTDCNTSTRALSLTTFQLLPSCKFYNKLCFVKNLKSVVFVCKNMTKRVFQVVMTCFLWLEIAAKRKVLHRRWCQSWEGCLATTTIRLQQDTIIAAATTFAQTRSSAEL